METFKLVRTKRGAIRQYNSIMARCRRDLSGGLAYGMDWPTLRATFPDRYNYLHKLNALFPTLPE